MDDDIKQIIDDFIKGTISSLDNNLALGIGQATQGQIEGNSTAYYVGRLSADLISMFIGAFSTVAGGGAELLGILANSTGVLTPAGVLLNVAGAVAIAGGTTITANSINNFAEDVNMMMSEGTGNGMSLQQSAIVTDKYGPWTTYSIDMKTDSKSAFNFGSFSITQGNPAQGTFGTSYEWNVGIEYENPNTKNSDFAISKIGVSYASGEGVIGLTGKNDGSTAKYDLGASTQLIGSKAEIGFTMLDEIINVNVDVKGGYGTGESVSAGIPRLKSVIEEGKLGFSLGASHGSLKKGYGSLNVKAEIDFGKIGNKIKILYGNLLNK